MTAAHPKYMAAEQKMIITRAGLAVPTKNHFGEDWLMAMMVLTAFT